MAHAHEFIKRGANLSQGQSSVADHHPHRKADPGGAGQANEGAYQFCHRTTSWLWIEVASWIGEHTSNCWTKMFFITICGWANEGESGNADGQQELVV